MEAFAQSKYPEIIQRLIDDPTAVNALQAQRLLEVYLGSRDKLKIRPSQTLSFPAADLLSCEIHGDRAEITSTFLSLLGAQMPFPHALVHSDNTLKSPLLKSFLIILNQRFYHALYQSWRSRQPYLWVDHQMDWRKFLNPRGLPLAFLPMMMQKRMSRASLIALVKKIFPEMALTVSCEAITDKKLYTSKGGSRFGVLTDNIVLGGYVKSAIQSYQFLMGPMHFETVISCYHSELQRARLTMIREHLGINVPIRVSYEILPHGRISALTMQGNQLGVFSVLGESSKIRRQQSRLS